MDDERARVEWYIHHRLERKKRNLRGTWGPPDTAAQISMEMLSLSKLDSKGALLGIRQLLVPRPMGT